MIRLLICLALASGCRSTDAAPSPHPSRVHADRWVRIAWGWEPPRVDHQRARTAFVTVEERSPGLDRLEVVVYDDRDGDARPSPAEVRTEVSAAGPDRRPFTVGDIALPPGADVVALARIYHAAWDEPFEIDLAELRR